jgi:hypothetical protein
MTPPGPRQTEWQALSDEAQVALSQHAMRRAALIIADQAQLFAVQFSSGVLQDRGAADALALFATLLRETSVECLTQAGHA